MMVAVNTVRSCPDTSRLAIPLYRMPFGKVSQFCNILTSYFMTI
jgi:hypothetical protein